MRSSWVPSQNGLDGNDIADIMRNTGKYLRIPFYDFIDKYEFFPYI